MPNVDIDLGDLPYLVALHQDENLAFEPAKIDDKGHGVLQQLKFDPPPASAGDATPRLGGGATTLRSATALMREIEFAQCVPSIKQGPLTISRLRGFGFAPMAGPADLGESIARGTDVPVKGSMTFTFAVCLFFDLPLLSVSLTLRPPFTPLSGQAFLSSKRTLWSRVLLFILHVLKLRRLYIFLSQTTSRGHSANRGKLLFLTCRGNTTWIRTPSSDGL